MLFRSNDTAYEMLWRDWSSDVCSSDLRSPTIGVAPMSRNDPYPEDIGYGKPPVNTRFKKGASGNPRGRPKGSLNAGETIHRVLNKKVSVDINGRRVNKTMLEIIFTQQANKAAKGDASATKIVMILAQLADRWQAEKAEKEPTVIVLQGADRYA